MGMRISNHLCRIHLAGHLADKLMSLMTFLLSNKYTGHLIKQIKEHQKWRIIAILEWTAHNMELDSIQIAGDPLAGVLEWMLKIKILRHFLGLIQGEVSDLLHQIRAILWETHNKIFLLPISNKMGQEWPINRGHHLEIILDKIITSLQVNNSHQEWHLKIHHQDNQTINNQFLEDSKLMSEEVMVDHVLDPPQLE